MLNNSDTSRVGAPEDATNGVARSGWTSPSNRMGQWLEQHGRSVHDVKLRDESGSIVPFPSFDEWLKRTSIPRVLRSTRLKKVDACYADFLSANKRACHDLHVIAALRGALSMLCTEEGGWTVSPRNKASKGLIARLEKGLDRFGPLKPITSDPQSDVRFAILWLLSGVEVELDPLMVVQTVGKHIANGASLTQAVGTVRNANLLPHFTTAASGFCDTMIEAHMEGNAEASKCGNVRGASWFRKLRAAVEKMFRDVLYSIVEDCKKKWEIFTDPSWDGLVDIVKTAVDYVMRFTKGLPNALTEGWEAIKGIGKIAGELKHRWHRQSLLRGFQCRAGHLGGAIEAMERGVRTGLVEEAVDTVVSTVSVVVSLCAPMIGPLIVPIGDALMWFYKFVKRTIEKIRIRRFLKQASDYFDRAPRAGVAGAQRFQPSTGGGGGIVMQPEQFNAFFYEGCRISPVIPMLVMNSGVCGDLFSKAVFPDTLSDAAYMSYAKAMHYFAAAREACMDYLKTSGFSFSVKPGREQASGLIEMAWKERLTIG